MDALGHVNNTIYFRWFESSRIAFLHEAGVSDLMQSSKLGAILAATNCSFKRQLAFPDTVRVGTRMTRTGRSSMTLHHVVVSETLQDVAADGESVVVVFDYQNQRPVRVPDDMRVKLDQLHS
jgi:acyl-CoA thioester hydrolase